MLGLRHPFTGALYEKDLEGHIKVTESNGAWGLFLVNGKWVRGEVRSCDPQMCNWVGGPQFGNHRLTPSSS